MFANDRAKQLGCKNIGQVADMTEQSLQTLNNWFKNPKKKRLFDVACIGVAFILKKDEDDEKEKEEDEHEEQQ